MEGEESSYCWLHPKAVTALPISVGTRHNPRSWSTCYFSHPKHPTLKHLWPIPSIVGRRQNMRVITPFQARGQFPSKKIELLSNYSVSMVTWLGWMVAIYTVGLTELQVSLQSVPAIFAPFHDLPEWDALYHLKSTTKIPAPSFNYNHPSKEIYSSADNNVH